VIERSSRDALARNLVILVAGSGLLIAIVGLVAIALLLVTLSAPAIQPAKQHTVADGCYPPVEAPLNSPVS